MIIKLQKWAIRTISNSHYKSHTGPFFLNLFLFSTYLMPINSALVYLSINKSLPNQDQIHLPTYCNKKKRKKKVISYYECIISKLSFNLSVLLYQNQNTRFPIPVQGDINKLFYICVVIAFLKNIFRKLSFFKCCNQVREGVKGFFLSKNTIQKSY